ncbi:hypothetical protein BH09DEP1_BH09DEP1_1890 [soil metagenome]
MRYFFFFLLLFSAHIFSLQKDSSRRQLIASSHSRYTQELILSDVEKNSREIQLDDLCSSLINDLKAYAKPEQIQTYLDKWDNLKTSNLNISTEQINKVVTTARTMQELAGLSARTYTENAGLRSSNKTQFVRDSVSDSYSPVQNYINAQLNYDKISDYLGIKKS